LPVPSTFSSVPPTRATFSPVDDPTSRRRAESLPPTAVVPVFDGHAEDDKLTRNPKQWSANDLASYIATALQAGNELNVADQEDLLHAIKEQTITGRDFLRLTDADLARYVGYSIRWFAPIWLITGMYSSLSFTTPQRLYLLKASRELRADTLRGRTLVDSYHSKDTSRRSNGIYTQRTFGSSSSSIDGLYNQFPSSEDPFLPAHSSMGTDGELPPSPAITLNRSNSVSDSSAQRYRDLAHMRIRRRGKVRGLVETWERESGAVSGSEGSMSGSDAESDSDIPSAESPPLSSLSTSTSSLSNPPPPYTSLGVNKDEPTMEELLASSGAIEGARAWEEDCGLGETVKRVPTSALTSLSFAASSPKVAKAIEFHVESTECSLSVAGSGRVNKQKRVVTAIFTGGSDRKTDGKSVDEVPQASLNPEEVVDIHIEPDIKTTAVELTVARPEDVFSAPGQVTETPSGDDAVIAALEASIANTRAQLEIFEARLEVIEAQLVAKEAVDQIQFQPEYALQSHQLVQSRVRAQVPDVDDVTFSDYRLGLKNFARTIIAHTIGWIYPYAHPGAQAPRSRAASRSPVRPRDIRFRLSSVIMFSFVLCAAVLRKVAYGRGVQGR